MQKPGGTPRTPPAPPHLVHAAANKHALEAQLLAAAGLKYAARKAHKQAVARGRRRLRAALMVGGGDGSGGGMHVRGSTFGLPLGLPGACLHAMAPLLGHPPPIPPTPRTLRWKPKLSRSLATHTFSEEASSSAVVLHVCASASRSAGAQCTHTSSSASRLSAVTNDSRASTGIGGAAGSRRWGAAAAATTAVAPVVARACGACWDSRATLGPTVGVVQVDA